MEYKDERKALGRAPRCAGPDPTLRRCGLPEPQRGLAPSSTAGPAPPTSSSTGAASTGSSSPSAPGWPPWPHARHASASTRRAGSRRASSASSGAARATPPAPPPAPPVNVASRGAYRGVNTLALWAAAEPRLDHAQYVAHRLRLLRGDRRAIFTAPSQPVRICGGSLPASVRADRSLPPFCFGSSFNPCRKSENA